MSERVVSGDGIVVGCAVVVVFFAGVWVGCGFTLMVSAGLRGLRHAGGSLSLQRFGLFFVRLICACSCVRVGYSSVAAERFGFLPCVWLGLGLLVRWWFENSRACLYYFFIVNDCQSIACLLVCSGGCLRDG